MGQVHLLQLNVVITSLFFEYKFHLKKKKMDELIIFLWHNFLG